MSPWSGIFPQEADLWLAIGCYRLSPEVELELRWVVDIILLGGWLFAGGVEALAIAALFWLYLFCNQRCSHLTKYLKTWEIFWLWSSGRARWLYHIWYDVYCVPHFWHISCFFFMATSFESSRQFQSSWNSPWALLFYRLTGGRWAIAWGENGSKDQVSWKKKFRT